MRYCLSSKSGTNPRRSSLSKRETPKPHDSALRLVTVGGSCIWSPTSTPATALVSGMSATGSGACVASSTHATRKVKPSNNSSPAPTHVQHTTSASLKTCSAATRSIPAACRLAAAPRGE